MPDASNEAHSLASLRQRAADQLGGSRPATGKRAGQIDAMAVLHQLASSPATAGDAMALLHELQVHQVELDLQQEELLRSQSELETALRRQADLVERAPVGYMTIDARTVLCEINLAGARLLGATSKELLGLALTSFLTLPSIEALQALLARTRPGRAPETCELELKPILGTHRTVQAAVDQDITPGRFLLVLMAPALTQMRHSDK